MLRFTKRNQRRRKKRQIRLTALLSKKTEKRLKARPREMLRAMAMVRRKRSQRRRELSSVRALRRWDLLRSTNFIEEEGK